MHKQFRHLCLALAALIAAGTLLAALIPAAEAVTYKKGSSGAVVSQIQTKLKNWGYYAGDVDGVYGSATERAVRAFQRKNGLTADGKAGAQTLEALGLPADKKIYLIMTGGIGCGDAVSLCDAIRRVPDENALLCVLPGRNEALRQALEDAYHGQGVLTVPFTDQVPVYMHAADVLLSKAGGISSSEAAMLGMPLVQTMVIPGVETENAAFFARHGLSFFARNVDEAARFADRLIYDPACAERILAAQSACLPRDGAEQIAAAITAQ